MLLNDTGEPCIQNDPHLRSNQVESCEGKHRSEEKIDRIHGCKGVDEREHVVKARLRTRGKSRVVGEVRTWPER